MGTFGWAIILILLYMYMHMYTYMYVHICVHYMCCVLMLGHSVVSDSLQPHGLQPVSLLCPCWVAMPSPRGSSQRRDQTQVSGIVGGFFTIWATRKSYPWWRWVAYPFCRESSQPRNQIGASHIAGKFFTSWATSI